jgi:hypothetical protein
MTVIAHAGHWIEGAIFAAPVLIVAGALGVSTLRERRRRKRGEVEPPQLREP